jgi:hypothetical protein
MASDVILSFLTVSDHEPTMKLDRHSPVSNELAEKMTNSVDRFLSGQWCKQESHCDRFIQEY